MQDSFVDNNSIDVASLKAGIYFISVTTTNGVINKKIVISK
jgi:hypothetical protein